MIALEKTRRIDQIAFRKCIHQLRYCHLRLKQFAGIRLDLKLRLLAALHNYCGNAGNAVQTGLNSVCSKLPELGLGKAVRG